MVMAMRMLAQRLLLLIVIARQVMMLTLTMTQTIILRLGRRWAVTQGDR